MKRIINILVCLALGAITTSCLFTEKDLVSTASDTIFCEPANETHYMVYSVETKGHKNSTLVPYVYEDKTKYENNVIDTHCVGDYLFMTNNIMSTTHYTTDGINFSEKTYKISLFFDTYIVSYYFVVVLPKTYSTECKHFEPTFEFVDCVTKELGDEEFNGKLYCCTEATITLRAHQGEKVFDFVKTVKLGQEYIDVPFNIKINNDYDDQNVTKI
jgi:hypothetical protein